MAVAVGPLIIKTKDGKGTVGYVRGHIFRKEVHKKNMLESPPGWTIEADTFAMLPRYGVTVIQVAVKDTKRVFVTTYDTFERNCLDVDRGTGPHKALALGYWKDLPDY